MAYKRMRNFQLVIAALALASFLLVGCAGSEEVATDSTGEWITLFDGESLDGWEMSGPGSFTLEPDGSMLSHGGMGLFYYTERRFDDFVLELEWKVESDSANSGIFVRFPDAPDPWYAVNTGYEIQIDDSQDPIHQTGAVYDFSAPFRLNSNPAGEWNTYRIEVTGQRYQIYLNGEKVNDFFGDRSLEGYVGLQNHDDMSQAWFRNIRVRPIAPAASHESLAQYLSVDEQREPIHVLVVTATHGYRHQSIETIHEILPEIGETTEFEFDLTEDLSDLTDENLERYDLLLFANSTLRVEGSQDDDTDVDDGRQYGFSFQIPSGQVQGTLVFTGLDDGAPEGTIQMGPGAPAVELDNVLYDDPTLNFSFPAGQYGQIDVEGELTDARFTSRWTSTQGSIDVIAERTNQRTAVTEGVSESQRDAVRRFLQSGKGIAGAHAGLDAFYEWDWYREMVGGGLFEEHPWTQSVRILVEEPDHPAVEHFGESFWIRDEIYVLDENPRWNSRVLASLDMNSVGVRQGPADITSNDYPISWVREHDGGRVFYTKLGHFDDVWTTPSFMSHLLQGMRIAAGRLDAPIRGHREKDILAEDVWPDDIAVDERGNVWIAELRGKVHRYDAESGETAQIAQIETTDPFKIEHGLYGIEVDPNFYGGEPFVYLYYAEPETFINTLSRFEYRNGRLDPASEEVLLRVPTEPQCCHQAGDLEWGPDGTLYLSTGDTGMSETRPSWEMSEEEIQAFLDRNDLKDYHWSRLVDSERSAQNLQDLRGKILRIHKDGSIPKDNPFFGEPGIRWEIYAYGLRNPYRIKVDPSNGDLYIAVVGPDAVYDFDEYNVSENGGENFGWPRTLGKLFYNEIRPEHIPSYVPPMWEYTYETGGRSATFGPIYRHDGPGAFPNVFQDRIFLFDWSRRWIKWAGIADDTFESEVENSVKREPLNLRIPARRLVDIKTFDVLTLTTPISMELGPDGSVYVAEFDGFWDAGPNARVSRYRWNLDRQTLTSTE